MSHTPHQLPEEFPEHAGKMRELRRTDPHFARIFEQYHEVNRAVHRAETDVEPASDARLTDLRRRRMALKDEVYAALTSG